MNYRKIFKTSSLLQKVLSEVIQNEVRNPLVHPLTTISRISLSKDLRYAKVFITIFAEEEKQEESIRGLEHSSSFIEIMSSRRVRLPYFPKLRFFLDREAKKRERIDALLEAII